MRDSIDPDAPLDESNTDFMEHLRRLDGAIDPRPAPDAQLNDVLDHALNALTKATEARLNLIDDALSRIIEGSYGFCMQCGAEIALSRLEVMPATCLCGGCDV
ncbi:MAG: TraR/DksA family transcriptional regulator [Roseinatronobacter sp.]